MAGKLRKHCRNLLPKLLLLAVSTLLCLIAGEIGVRWLLPAYDPGRQILFHRNGEGVPLGDANSTTVVRTPKGDWETKIEFNKYGFRDPRDTALARGGDIVAVGDSFTFGWGVETGERFSSLLESKTGVPVYNIAIPGDIRDYALLVHYAERKRAVIKRLVIGICMENDLEDYSTHDQSNPVQIAQGGRSSLRQWLKTHSGLYLAASYVLQSQPWGERLLVKLGIARNIEQITATNTYSENVLVSSRDELVKLAQNYDTVVLIIPSRALWYGKNIEVERKVHDRFVQLVREAGLRVVDMRPVFEASGDPLSYYFKTDPHWNPKGHAAAAEALSREVLHEPQ